MTRSPERERWSPDEPAESASPASPAFPACLASLAFLAFPVGTAEVDTSGSDRSAPRDVVELASARVRKVVSAVDQTEDAQAVNAPEPASACFACIVAELAVVLAVERSPVNRIISSTLEESTQSRSNAPEPSELASPAVELAAPVAAVAAPVAEPAEPVSLALLVSLEPPRLLVPTSTSQQQQPSRPSLALPSASSSNVCLGFGQRYRFGREREMGRWRKERAKVLGSLRVREKEQGSRMVQGKAQRRKQRETGAASGWRKVTSAVAVAEERRTAAVLRRLATELKGRVDDLAGRRNCWACRVASTSLTEAVAVAAEEVAAAVAVQCASLAIRREASSAVAAERVCEAGTSSSANRNTDARRSKTRLTVP